MGTVTAVALYATGGPLYGTLCTVHPSVRAIPSGEMALLRLAGRMVMHAITAAVTREHERQWALQSARYAELVAASDDAIYSTDVTRRVQSWNAGAARLYGYSAGEMIGRSADLLVPPDRVDETEDLRLRVVSGEHVVHYDTVRRRKDGSLVDVSLTVSPIVDEHGRVTGMSAVVRDVSHRVRAQRESDRARAAAEELAQLRQQQAEEAEVLSEVGAAVARRLEPESLYQAILEQVARLVPYDIAGIALVEHERYVVVASAGGPWLPAGTVFEQGPRPDRLAATGPARLRYVPDTHLLPAGSALPTEIEQVGARSLIDLPLTVDGKHAGFLGIASRTPNAYTDRHVCLVGLFGERVTQALSNARLYATEQARVLAAEELARLRQEQAQEAQAMAAISAALSGPLESEQVYRVILDEAARLLSFHAANIHLYEQGWAVVAASAGEKLLVVGTRHFQLTGGAPCWIPRPDRVSYLPDTAQEPLWRDIAPHVGDHRLRSCISMPFTFEGEPAGCFTIGSYSPQVYSEHHIRLARAFGELAAQALRNARLHESEQARTRAAEELVRVREAAGAAARFQAGLLDAVGQAVIATDLAGAITYWNRAAEQLYGWKAGEVLGRNVLEVTPSAARHGAGDDDHDRPRAGGDLVGRVRGTAP